MSRPYSNFNDSGHIDLLYFNARTDTIIPQHERGRDAATSTRPPDPKRRRQCLEEIVAAKDASAQLRRAAQEMIDWKAVLDDAFLNQTYDPRPGFYEADKEEEEKPRAARSLPREPNPADASLLGKCDYLLARHLLARTGI